MLTLILAVAFGLFVKDMTASALLGFLAFILTERVLRLTKKGLR